MTTSTNKIISKLATKLVTGTLSALLITSMPMTVAMQSANAAVANSASAATNLNNLLKNVKSMTANFSQTTSGTGGKGLSKASRNFSGTMAVQRPNQFRWQIDGTAAQLIVANGNTLWVYDKDLNQATKQSVSNQVGDTPALILSGDPSKIANSFNVTQPIASKNYYVLYPKSGNANFKSLGIAFNSGNPVMMVLNDNLGQTTTIRFNNVKRNTSIASNQFSFTPPKGVDVINQ